MHIAVLNGLLAMPALLGSAARPVAETAVDMAVDTRDTAVQITPESNAILAAPHYRTFRP